jgi:hypothetical protein
MLRLQPNPTFTAQVQIPVAGGEPEPVQFEFKHRTRDETRELVERKELTDDELVMAVACGWGLVEEFNAKNVHTLLQSYQAAAGAIYSTYLAQLSGVRLGN